MAGAPTNAVSGAGVANVARVAGAATKAVSGANAAKGSKGALPKVGALLLNGKK